MIQLWIVWWRGRKEKSIPSLLRNLNEKRGKRRWNHKVLKLNLETWNRPISQPSYPSCKNLINPKMVHLQDYHWSSKYHRLLNMVESRTHYSTLALLTLRRSKGCLRSLWHSRGVTLISTQHRLPPQLISCLHSNHSKIIQMNLILKLLLMIEYLHH